jgi:hypothetical protein
MPEIPSNVLLDTVIPTWDEEYLAESRVAKQVEKLLEQLNFDTYNNIYCVCLKVIKVINA